MAENVISDALKQPSRHLHSDATVYITLPSEDRDHAANEWLSLGWSPFLWSVINNKTTE